MGLAVKTPTFMFQTFKVQPYADVTLRGRFGDTESSYTLEGSKTIDTIDYDVAGKFVGDLQGSQPRHELQPLCGRCRTAESCG